jgi:hypothetical protein
MMVRARLTIEDRYEGPPEIANGGYVCGLLAETMGGPVEIRLERPVPLATELELVSGVDTAQLILGDRVLASARRSQAVDGTMPVVTLEGARRAVEARPRPGEHPFPNCFGCGPHRNAGDGLHLLPGRVSGTDIAACVWTPDDELTQEASEIPLRYLAVALDCPTYWPLIEHGEVALLGSLRLDFRQSALPGNDYIVVSWPLARNGRRMLGGGAVYTPDGELVAAGQATWIKVDWETVAAATGLSIRPDAGL